MLCCTSALHTAVAGRSLTGCSATGLAKRIRLLRATIQQKKAGSILQCNEPWISEVNIPNQAQTKNNTSSSHSTGKLTCSIRQSCLRVLRYYLSGNYEIIGSLPFMDRSNVYLKDLMESHLLLAYLREGEGRTSNKLQTPTGPYVKNLNEMSSS